jgi:hypothetical protein
MKGINEFTAEEVKWWPNQIETIDGWTPARPIGMGGFKLRVKKAWKVFTGKADVLVWHRQ